MRNYYYKDSISSFLSKNINDIIGEISLDNTFDTALQQNRAWEYEIVLLQKALVSFEGTIFFEFSIPRMGKRVDVLLLIKGVVFLIKFKVGEKNYLRTDVEQVYDYALDLKYFHEPSHNALIVPILLATEASHSYLDLITTSHNDKLLEPIRINKFNLNEVISNALTFFFDEIVINSEKFTYGSYSPTPTIVEAAIALYQNHSVDNITRCDAGAINLSRTTSIISEIIDKAKSEHSKIICFVTGVPGAGKTLVGLKIATTRQDETGKTMSVYLSGNGPLVAVLQEALTRDRVNNLNDSTTRITKGKIKASVKTFIQNIHHYRDAYLVDPTPPYDHVAIFDEAQRAWNKEQTVNFMKVKKHQHNFNYSEPEFLISCLNRHEDWAVIICLVGGGQEINTGEAGIAEWLEAIKHSFSHWYVYISPNLIDSEYDAEKAINELKQVTKVFKNDDLHLNVSMRSFRAENLSSFVKFLLDMEKEKAKEMYELIKDNYPIVITRNLYKAKEWLKNKARGSERYGIIVSSQAQRLKPHAIDVRTPINPVHWFLNGKDDVRSSYFLEDVATEFQIQGLELDWSCVTWDGDLRYDENGWKTFSFVGTKWHQIRKSDRISYLINAYRVLLTRARQGMVIVVPEGNENDHTRLSEFYDPTYEYLREIGIPVL
ncbi:MAG: DUF2075 domain-containing protein [Bacteroidales bacterium]|nr:DUF2075 domain-containing protein [Bacteroidales bacterium]MDD3521680.1 DUF2075 domain-containing protein [Bacteroidales bacterium]